MVVTIIHSISRFIQVFFSSMIIFTIEMISWYSWEYNHCDYLICPVEDHQKGVFKGLIKLRKNPILEKNSWWMKLLPSNDIRNIFPESYRRKCPWWSLLPANKKEKRLVPNLPWMFSKHFSRIFEDSYFLEYLQTAALITIK